MRRLALALAALTACTASESEFAGNGGHPNLVGAGIGSEGGDDDADSAADTAGDTASDTAGSTDLSTCIGTDLDFAVSVKDEDGNETATLSYPTSATSTARFANGCTGTVRFTTADSCLVSAWTLSGPSDQSFSGNCVEETTTWTVAEGDAIEVSVDWGTLDRGSWYVAATSALDGSTQTVFFTVQ